MEFFVYAHLNPISLIPFYIGKGKGKRATDKNDRSVHWNNVVNKYGFIPIVLVDGLSDKDACEIEKQYIKKYGFKKHNGTLINQTAGGTGGNTFDPIGGKNWNSGKVGIYSEETIKKLRHSRLGKKHSPEVKEKVLIGLQKARQSNINNAMNVRCLISGKIYKNRWDCIADLNINLKVFQQWIWKNRPIKGHHLQYLKN